MHWQGSAVVVVVLLVVVVVEVEVEVEVVRLVVVLEVVDSAVGHRHGSGVVVVVLLLDVVVSSERLTQVPDSKIQALWPILQFHLQVPWQGERLGFAVGGVGLLGSGCAASAVGGSQIQRPAASG